MSKFHNNQIHGYHLVDPSPWPIISAFSALMLTFGLVLFMNGYRGGTFLLPFGLCMILFMMVVCGEILSVKELLKDNTLLLYKRG